MAGVEFIFDAVVQPSYDAVQDPPLLGIEDPWPHEQRHIDVEVLGNGVRGHGTPCASWAAERRRATPQIEGRAIRYGILTKRELATSRIPTIRPAAISKKGAASIHSAFIPEHTIRRSFRLTSALADVPRGRLLDFPPSSNRQAATEMLALSDESKDNRGGV